SSLSLDRMPFPIAQASCLRSDAEKLPGGAGQPFEARALKSFNDPFLTFPFCGMKCSCHVQSLHDLILEHVAKFHVTYQPMISHHDAQCAPIPEPQQFCPSEPST